MAWAVNYSRAPITFQYVRIDVLILINEKTRLDLQADQLPPCVAAHIQINVQSKFNDQLQSKFHYGPTSVKFNENHLNNIIN